MTQRNNGLVVFCCLALFLGACGEGEIGEGEEVLKDSEALTLSSPVDLWVYEKLPLDGAEATRFFAFAAKYGVREIYIESNTLIAQYPDQFTAFIATAADKGIQVALLFGNHKWVRPEYQAEAVSFTTRAARFVEKLESSGKARPSRIHFDIEPHVLSEWRSSMNTTAKNFLTLLDKLKVAKGSLLEMMIDIPFWYDNRSITIDGVARPLSERIIDKVDSVAMMNYRDTSSRLISGAQSEIDYATKKGKRVVVGVMSSCNVSDSSITFCDEGPTAMMNALNAVTTRFAGQSGFGGTAVYHYSEARKLLP